MKKHFDANQFHATNMLTEGGDSDGPLAGWGGGSRQSSGGVGGGAGGRRFWSDKHMSH